MQDKSRREFLTTVGSLLTAGCVMGCGGAALLWPGPAEAAGGNLDMCFDGQCGRKIFGEKIPFDKVASYWQPLSDKRVQCFLCPYDCVLEDGERCRCNGKENYDGELFDILYGYVATIHIDTIEKLPIYHRFPGLKTLSLGTAGCAFHCKYCQNWQLSQVQPEKVEKYRLLPDDILKLAAAHNLEAIALAYTEPLTFFEYSLDLAQAAKKAGLKVFMGTGGFANPGPVSDIAPYLDGVAFGLKGFSDEFYTDVVGSGIKLDDVLASLDAFKAGGAHVEVANLVVPTKNDSTPAIAKLSEYVKKNLGSDTPTHFLKFFPHYKYRQLPATGQKAMETAVMTAREVGLQHVYIGNLPGHSSNNTYCPSCSELAIQRIGFRILAVNLDDQDNCLNCGTRLPGDYTPRFITN